MTDTPRHPEPPAQIDLLAGALSYLVPGLGQIVRGRVAKGLLFLIGLHVLFFYGMMLGQWRNVYLPDSAPPRDGFLSRIGQDLYNRPHFAGQFWIGVAAWPGVYQYMKYDDADAEGPIFGKFQRQPPMEEINELQRDTDKVWDLGWVYTVIAGVLNLLVIYDAAAGAAYHPKPEDKKDEPDKEPAES